MAKRVRHPMVSFAMFLIVCSMAVVAWEHRHMLKGEKAGQLLARDERDRIQDDIYVALENDECFAGLRSNINWRPNEQRYRLDIELEDGEHCEIKARSVCEQVALLIQQETGVDATVVAFDAAGREIGRCVL